MTRRLRIIKRSSTDHQSLLKVSNRRVWHRAITHATPSTLSGKPSRSSSRQSRKDSYSIAVGVMGPSRLQSPRTIQSLLRHSSNTCNSSSNHSRSRHSCYRSKTKRPRACSSSRSEGRASPTKKPCLRSRRSRKRSRCSRVACAKLRTRSSQ